MKDALDKVREELGPEAVILEARQSHGRGIAALLSILGLRRNLVFEVTAAVDSTAEPRNLEFNSALVEAQRTATPARVRTHASEGKWIPSPSPSMPQQVSTVEPAPIPVSMPEPVLDMSSQPVAEAVPRPVPVGARRSSIVPGGADVRATLKVIAEETQVRARVAELPEPCADLFRRLVNEDVSENVALAMVEHLAADADPSLDAGSFVQQAARRCSQLISVSGPIQIEPGRRRVVAFTGPTGVGKTTTIAKIAAGFALYDQARVAMVTADTYRIAAIDQIQTYGQIMGVPVEIVHSPRDMEQVMAELHDYELVLIDTAGRNPNNPARMYELRSILSAAAPDEVHLVLSATTRRRDLDNLVERFQTVGFDRIILSKLDESMTIGAIFNVHAKSQTPFSYITNGQNVPEDIKAITQNEVAEMLLAKWRSGGGL